MDCSSSALSLNSLSQNERLQTESSSSSICRLKFSVMFLCCGHPSCYISAASIIPTLGVEHAESSMKKKPSRLSVRLCRLLLFAFQVKSTLRNQHSSFHGQYAPSHLRNSKHKMISPLGRSLKSAAIHSMGARQKQTFIQIHQVRMAYWLISTHPTV